MTDPLLLANLMKNYGRVKAVDSLSIGVTKSQCFGLLGQSGAGKTTVFRMLTGETAITRGNAFFNGFDVKTNLKVVSAVNFTYRLLLPSIFFFFFLPANLLMDLSSFHAEQSISFGHCACFTWLSFSVFFSLVLSSCFLLPTFLLPPSILTTLRGATNNYLSQI